MKSYLQEVFLRYKVRSLSFDSRKIRPGDVFFAIKGEKFDGNSYIDEVIAKGAALVFTDDILRANQNSNIIYLENIRSTLSVAAGIFYKSLPKNLLAVTGTNGKTSVVSYIYQILALLGQTSASIGTIGIECSKQLPMEILALQPKYFTTPDPISFRQTIDALANYGVDNVAFEASSHGLAQFRLGDIKVNSAAFTSFSQDHLEYHNTMDEYLEAKLLLFSEHLVKNGEAVISSDMDVISKVVDHLNNLGIKYCKVGKAGDIRIKKTVQKATGQDVVFEFAGQEFSFSTDIIGSFQASNLLIAAKMVSNIGFDFSEIIKILPQIKAVSGRLERVTHKDADFHVFVDYAHTPDALEKSLSELKSILPIGSKLFVVFGCGGDRDRSKRPIMGDIASRIADIVMITDDNPRSEDPANIRREIMSRVSACEEIGDRKLAIANAIDRLQKYDILLIAGKGHEDYQIIGDKTFHFNDVEVAKECLAGKVI